MSAKFDQCPTCGNQSLQYVCNGCGANVTHQEDAVRIEVAPIMAPGHRTAIDYCRPCAVRQLPAAVGVGPGSDLPASLEPPEQSA